VDPVDLLRAFTLARKPAPKGKVGSGLSLEGDLHFR